MALVPRSAPWTVVERHIADSLLAASRSRPLCSGTSLADSLIFYGLLGRSTIRCQRGASHGEPTHLKSQRVSVPAQRAHVCRHASLPATWSSVQGYNLVMAPRRALARTSGRQLSTRPRCRRIPASTREPGQVNIRYHLHPHLTEPPILARDRPSELFGTLYSACLFGLCCEWKMQVGFTQPRTHISSQNGPNMPVTVKPTTLLSECRTTLRAASFDGLVQGARLDQHTQHTDEGTQGRPARDLTDSPSTSLCL